MSEHNKILGEFLKRRREAARAFTERLGKCLRLSKQAGRLRLGDRQSIVRQEKSSESQHTQLGDSWTFCEKLVLAGLLPDRLFNLLQLTTELKAMPQKPKHGHGKLLSTDEAEIIYLKHCHDRLMPLVENGSSIGVKKNGKGSTEDKPRSGAKAERNQGSIEGSFRR